MRSVPAATPPRQREKNLLIRSAIGQNADALYSAFHSTMPSAPSPRSSSHFHRVAARALLAAALELSAAWCFADADPPPLRIIAMSGTPVPGGGTFDRFQVEGQPAITPVNDDGKVAFFATLARARASEGMFVSDGKHIEVIALNGTPSPGGGKLLSFAAHPVPALNRAGAIAFSASIAGGKASEGMFLSANRRLRAIALSGSTAPGISGGAFSEFQAPALNDSGDVVFLASVRHRRDVLEAIYLYHAGKLRKIAAAGDAAPEGGTFEAFGAPALNNKGEIAFAAVIDDGPYLGGIVVISPAGARLVVGTGITEPFGGIISQFSDRVSINDSGAVLFNTALKLGPMAQALFVAEDEKLRPVASVGRASSSNNPFSALGSWTALSDDGSVAFIAAADDSSGTMGLYQADSTAPTRRAAVGDTLDDGAKLAAFPLYPAVAASPRGALAFTIVRETAEGSNEAIVIAPPPKPAR